MGFSYLCFSYYSSWYYSYYLKLHDFGGISGYKDTAELKENLKKDVNLLPGVSSMKDILKHSLDQVFEEKIIEPALPQLITDDENCEGKNAKV